MLSVRFIFTRNYWKYVLLAVSACGLLVPAGIFSQKNNGPAPDHSDIIDFLDKNISWYQHNASLQQIVTSPGDNFFINSDQPTADQVVHLAFDFARARVNLTDSDQSQSTSQATSSDSRFSGLAQTVVRLGVQGKQVQSQIDELQKKLNTAPASQKNQIKSEIDALQSISQLLKTRQDTLQSLIRFAGGSNGRDSLTAQIDALEQALPAKPAQQDSSTATIYAPVSPIPTKQIQPGIIGLIRRIYDLSEKMRMVNEAIRQTEQLQQSTKQMQAPLRGELAQLIQQSDAIINQQLSQELSTIADQKDALDASAKRFKLVTAVLLPLGKQTILLNAYEKNLQDWQSATKNEYTATLKNLLMRFAFLAIFLAIVLGLFELWRRAILRYIADIRKRYQFLLLRRIALSIVIVLLVISIFISGLGSLATYIGLLTAGIAVAMQNVILAIVGYFMLIGKFGVRIGDRVQVSGITGKVVEIGLIRIHIMELSGAEADAQPTGRIVAFSNSVVFQPAAGLFKQVPGSGLVWHEMNLTFASNNEYRVVEERMMKAVETAFEDYHADLERLRYQMEMNLSSVALSELQPKVRLRLTATGIEVHIRFPAELKKATQLDQRVAEELMRAIEQEPRLQVVAADIPTLTPKVN